MSINIQKQQQESVPLEQQAYHELKSVSSVAAKNLMKGLQVTTRFNMHAYDRCIVGWAHKGMGYVSSCDTCYDYANELDKLYLNDKWDNLFHEIIGFSRHFKENHNGH